MSVTYRQNPKTAARVVDDQAFVVAPGHRELMTLNETATVLWELAAEGCTVEAAAAALAQRFEVDLDRATHDALACFRDLVDRDLLVVE